MVYKLISKNLQEQGILQLKNKRKKEVIVPAKTNPLLMKSFKNLKKTSGMSGKHY